MQQRKLVAVHVPNIYLYANALLVACCVCMIMIKLNKLAFLSHATHVPPATIVTNIGWCTVTRPSVVIFIVSCERCTVQLRNFIIVTRFCRAPRLFCNDDACVHTEHCIFLTYSTCKYTKLHACARHAEMHAHIPVCTSQLHQKPGSQLAWRPYLRMK